MNFSFKILITRQRLGIIVSLLVIVPLGFYTKFYSGPAADWVNNSLGGVFYEIFWCLIVSLLLSKVNPSAIALTVFVVTCTLELLQLWHPAFLELIRRSFIGRTILGSSFSWSDFPYYFVGSVIGWWWIKQVKDHPSTCSG